jgi:hypothetical protein
MILDSCPIIGIRWLTCPTSLRDKPCAMRPALLSLDHNMKEFMGLHQKKIIGHRFSIQTDFTEDPGSLSNFFAQCEY